MTTAPTDSDFTLTADAVGIGSTALFGIGSHQSQLPPAENKFHKGNGQDGKHYWLTPWDEPAIAQLVADYGPFDFDPCPCPKPDDFDGLTCEWGQRNWVNPPFGSIMHMGKKKGPTAWMRKAIEEQAKGKLSVVVYPVDKWVLMMLKSTGAVNVRNLGDVRWLATEDGTKGKGTGRHIAAFILLPNVKGHASPEHAPKIDQTASSASHVPTCSPSYCYSLEQHDGGVILMSMEGNEIILNAEDTRNLGKHLMAITNQD